MAMDYDIFSDIVAGRAPASVVHEDDTIMAFLTIGPVNPGHVLVIPKGRFVYLNDLDEETGTHLFRITRRVARAIRESGVRCEGINLFLADGEVAFQEVGHVHMHVFPRFAGDSFRIDADWNARPSREQLDEIAGKIRATLGSQNRR
jgi:diadenosine tetraphosphate (Ap4A) HIT family hydrolase